MVRGTQTLRRGFSLIELVIVIVIIGIIAAIAIPRMSRGAEGAAESSLKANLAVLRNAIDLFQSEHEGKYPNTATIAAELTGFTDLAVTTTSSTRNTATGVIYGPYLREIPPLPVKPSPGFNAKATGIAAVPAAAVGWIYIEATGKINANSSVAGVSDSRPYNEW